MQLFGSTTAENLPCHLDLQLASGAEPWRGPSYAYRGARIECHKGGHVCGLFLEGHPLNRMSFGVPGTITPLVDLWVERGELPSYMRVVPKAGEGPDSGHGPSPLHLRRA